MPARTVATSLAALGAIAAVSAMTVAVGAWTVPSGGAVVVERAARHVEPRGELVVVIDRGDVDAEVVAATGRAAAAAEAIATPARTGSLGMRSIERAGSTVHAAPSGYLIPIVYSAVPSHSIGRIYGADVSQAVSGGGVVMNELTAELTGARAGDVITMQSASGRPVRLTVATIRSGEQIGSAELVFTTEVAARLGATADTRMIIYDVERSTIVPALEEQGLYDRRNTRVFHSWDPANPDGVLSTVRTKVALGEPVYRFNTDGSISMHPDWVASNLRPGREQLNDMIPVRARCHVAVVDDLRAALAEVADAGLGGEIDVANANTYGGCYAGARFSRLSGQIGFLSRHSYGMAFDTNTVSNCLGCRPQMDCDVVRIFRKHGFAWGGNFRIPDGMHFEWVGEPRHQIDAPSTYCPNLVSAPGHTESLALTRLGLDVVTLPGDDESHTHDHGP